ncbi:MAG TPA: TonB-dependent receptor [Methylophilaceae bacterium]|jgi:outer membrane receptor protein involved in Fe transport
MLDNNITIKPQPRSSRAAFQPKKIAIAIGAAATMMSASPLFAADDKLVNDLQAEITRLKQALEKSQQELAAQKNTPSNAQSSNEQTAPNSASAEPPQEEQKDLDTVVIRGRNRLEAVKDVPASISVVTGKELERLQAHDLASITQRVGNIAWAQGNARTSALSIRGIGKQAQTDAMDPDVGITVDGVSYSYNPFASFDFYDVDSVEVTRGPRGTAGGRASSVGAVSINSKKPSFKDSIDYSLTLGENNRVIASTNIGGAVIDDLLAWRGSFAVDKGEGVWDNKYNNDFSYKNKDNVSGRVQFLLTPAENFNALIKLQVTPKHEEYYNGWTYYTPTPTRYGNGAVNDLTSTNVAVSGASNRLGRAWFTNSGRNYSNKDFIDNVQNQDNQRPLVTATNDASATLNWDIGSHTLTSISAYKNFYFQARNDEGTPFDISKNGGGYVKRDEQFSQELSLTSNDNKFVSYKTGVHLLTQTNNYNSRTGFGSDAGAWFATNAQYNTLSTNSAGNRLLQNSLSGLEVNVPQDIDSKSAAWYGQADWHLSEPFTVTTGLRLSYENRKNSSARTIAQQGVGAALNPVAQGGFNSNATTGSTTGLTNTAAQTAIADALALNYFGVATYAGLSGAQQAQVAAAKALRNTNLGFQFNPIDAQTIEEVLPTVLLSPSYKLNEDVTTYASFQFGQKPGIAQVLNGASANAKTETATSYELGFKSILLDKTLTLNSDVYFKNIDNYQQQVQVADSTSSTGFSSLTGNAAGVTAYGLEVDSVYSGLSHTNIRFSGAYNEAYYNDFKNSSQPVENNNLALKYRDVTGYTLPGAAKWTFNLGADYRYPVLRGFEFHASANTAFTSRYNSDVALSSYAWVPSYSITDLSIGIGKINRKFDTTFLVKNAFDDRTAQVRTWNTYVPAVPRWIGVVFSGEF